ncbi:hypothetical protein WN943_008795 [Citrus x changshan-huyou]
MSKFLRRLKWMVETTFLIASKRRRKKRHVELVVVLNFCATSVTAVDFEDSAGMLSSVSLYKEERCDVPIFTRSI